MLCFSLTECWNSAFRTSGHKASTQVIPVNCLWEEPFGLSAEQVSGITSGTMAPQAAHRVCGRVSRRNREGKQTTVLHLNQFNLPIHIWKSGSLFFILRGTFLKKTWVCLYPSSHNCRCWSPSHLPLANPKSYLEDEIFNLGPSEASFLI